MENLSETLREPALHSESLEILRGLIERIVVTPTAKGLEVELVGWSARSRNR